MAWSSTPLPAQVMPRETNASVLFGSSRIASVKSAIARSNSRFVRKAAPRSINRLMQHGKSPSYLITSAYRSRHNRPERLGFFEIRYEAPPVKLCETERLG